MVHDLMSTFSGLLAADGPTPTNHFNWADGVAMGLGRMGPVIFFLDIVFLLIMGYVLVGALFSAKNPKQ